MSSAIRCWVLLAGAVSGLFTAACHSGSGSNESFQLQSVSVSGNGNWQLNRPILFQFSADIDFSTVNLNTIHIGQTDGGPALGEFTLVDPRTVKFQPRCPTLPDNSDAGLLPGGVSYTIQLPGVSSGGATVRSTSGGALDQSQTLRFNTVDSSDPAQLFIDTAIGPPNPVIRTDPAVTDACFIEIGDDPSNRVYFQPRAFPDSELGADTPAGFASGLNLYSDLSSHISILLAINQAVESSSANVSSSTVRLEYQSGSGAWISLAHTVALQANCAGTGALLRVTPTGILPQNHVVRIVLTSDFKDLIGDSNLISLTVGSFLVATATDPGTTTPGPAADQIHEDFSVGGSSAGSLEDTSSVLTDPRAGWATNGLLKASFDFGGTGGPTDPPGTFDWKIGNDFLPSPTNRPQVLLDTSFTVIQNDDQTASETVINGRVDIHNLLVTASGTLKIQGPNPCTILISGSAQIDGLISIKGGNNLSVVSLNLPSVPEPGATGTAGGGRGGTGSPLTSQSDPAGGNGFGAFNIADGGGVGGESAYNPHGPSSGDEARRPAGGGGGTLGHDLLRAIGPAFPGYTNSHHCPDQLVIGYDAEQGFSGYGGPLLDGVDGAIGVITGASPPRGGSPGPRPFLDDDPNNDFWGTMHDNVTGQLIRGELLHPWAGAGGGAGGDAIVSNSFPTSPYDPGGDEKGAGGGGGGGSLTILALGNITFGPHGRIEASGGTGGGGENSAAGDITHIGGGSGGGSGGHIILQTASQIDLRLLTSAAAPFQLPGGIFALGGNGGAGKNDLGGAHPGDDNPTTPNLDALPPNSYPHNDPLSPCGVLVIPLGYPAGFDNNACYDCIFPNGVLVAICAGGDGGPGLIQLHTPALTDILIPNSPETIYAVIKPPPVGSVPSTDVVPTYSAINNPLVWNQLLPIFGRKSQAISKWIPLGAASVSSDASSTIPGPVRFFFKGTDAAGAISTTGSGSSAQVAELSTILAGTIPPDNQNPPVYPFIDRDDQRTVVFDGTTLVDADDIYLRNLALMKRFLIRLTHGTATDFEVAFATYDPVTHVLRLTVDASGQPLAGFPAGSAVEVRPRFFRVLTNGIPNSLPSSSQIVADFQATIPNAQGDPDTNGNSLSAWVHDISLIDPNLPPPPGATNPDYKFFRFRISFDISANNAPLTFDAPIPSLDFFRIPFRF